ncbi:asparagine synthase (glutamine-hydrolyzing) [Hyphococcus sp.]|jgi:asparagine synthase (glutamine-hydrolysing)|uniref:asparagine synthase (glutamine-hydrolyzing) n=1 Tax=Hyphococcus sp. TaxID=2038636 RepID=UPI003D14E520
MCGIAGIFDLNGARDVDRAALKRMTDALAHRGPDGEGFYFAPGVGLGHRRLAIIDKEGGAQPFHAQSGGVLTYNGEIYNYEKLAQRLKHKIALKTRSDTEVLAEGLSLEGADYLQNLRGMFAFGFYEPGAHSLTLARDRLGERPLYYAETNDGFLMFASEIGALAASGLIDLSLDPRAAADYFFYGYVPDPKAIWRGVLKLPPAHWVRFERGKTPRLERYWRPVFANGGALAYDEAAELLRAQIDDAVKAQMISDVPMGAFLSGGVDSASILSSMAQAQGAVTACTIDFDGDDDESAAARAVAKKFAAVHYEDEANADSTALIDRVAAAMGEPFADASALPSYQVAEIARRHVTVALTGDGGDEIFAGYRRYPFFLGEERTRRIIPPPFRAALFGPLGALYPKLDWAPRPLRAKTTFQALAQSSAQGYAAAVAINLPSRMEAILNPDFTRMLGGYRPSSLIAEAMDASDAEDPLSRAQYADLMTWLPGRMLVKVDRTSMAHGLEARPPLLDHRIVEWAGALPPDYKLKHGTGKRILKDAFASRLGADHIARKKRGFAPPIREWMRRERNNPALRLNASQHWRESGLFSERAVDAMIRDFRSGRAECAQELWSVIMFDAFLRTARGG